MGKKLYYLHSIEGRALSPYAVTLRGDCKKIADDPDDRSRSALERTAIQLFGSAAKRQKEWVGLDVWWIAATFTQSARSGRLLHPAEWMRCNPQHPTVVELRKLHDLGLVEFVEGYAHPTQKLADMIIEAS